MITRHGVSPDPDSARRLAAGEVTEDMNVRDGRHIRGCPEDGMLDVLHPLRNGQQSRKPVGRGTGLMRPALLTAEGQG